MATVEELLVRIDTSVEALRREIDRSNGRVEFTMSGVTTVNVAPYRITVEQHSEGVDLPEREG